MSEVGEKVGERVSACVCTVMDGEDELGPPRGSDTAHLLEGE